MTSRQWREVRDLFERALDHPLEGLEPWVSHEAGDPAVAAEVMSLLRTHSKAGAFLDKAVTDRVDGLLQPEEVRFEPGAHVGTYEIDREIGRGGMGRVYLAIDSRLGRRVALKALAPSLVADPGQRERLRREARAAALLTHPAICTVYALEEIDGDVFIATEYVEGRTLREEIAAGRRPTPQDLLETARELTGAIASAHARGITHRDLKPENVMRSTSGGLKVLDFGLALVSHESAPLDAPRVTTPGTLIGTPAYMAPEQLDGGPVDARTDVFALGVLLYEFATGVHPFEGATPLVMAARILETDPAPLALARTDVPLPIAQMVDRCLRKRPSDRYANAGECLAALSRHEVRPATRRASPATWWRTHMAAVLALYFVAVAAGWLVKEWHQGLASAGFVLLAIAATVAGVFRAHLLFAGSTHDDFTFRRELGRSTRVLFATDLLIGAVLFAEGLVVAWQRPVPGVIVLGLGLGIGLARLVLERATTEAAFGRPDNR